MSLRSVLVDGSARGRPESEPLRIAVADDGRSALFTTGRPGGTVRVGRLSLDDGAVRHEGSLPGCDDALIAVHAERVLGVTSDGARLAWWDAREGRTGDQPLAVRGDPVACSPDGRFVALLQREPEAPWSSGPGHVVRVADGRPVATVARAVHAAFSGDGRFAVWSDTVGVLHTVDLRDDGSGATTTQTATGGRPVWPLAEREGARVALHLGTNNLLLLDLGTGELTPTRAERSATPHAFAAGQGLRAVWFMTMLRGVRDLATGELRVLDGTCGRAMALTPDGGSLLRFAGSHFALVDVESGATRTWHDGHESPVTALAWSRDGRHLATRSERGAVRVLDVRGASLAWGLEGAAGRGGALAFGADGRHLYAQSEAAFEAWDLATGDPIAHAVKRRQRAAAMAVSDDGRLLASAGGGHVVRLVDVSGTTRHAATVTGALRDPYHVAFDGPARLRCLCAESEPGYERPRANGRHFALWLDLRGRPLEDVTLPPGAQPPVAVEGAPRTVVTTRDDAVLRVDLDAAPVERTLRASLERPMALCAGAGLVVCEDGPVDARSLRVLAPDDGREVARMELARVCRRASLAPDGAHLAVAYADGGVEVFAVDQTDGA